MSSHPYIHFTDITGGLRVRSGSPADGLMDGSVTDVKIHPTFNSNNVVEIGIYAFQSTNIVSVFIPKTIQHIDQQTFYLGSHLSSVIFEPDSSLEKISHNAFRSCTSLEKIDLPSNLHTIMPVNGNAIFRDSINLQYI